MSPIIPSRYGHPKYNIFPQKSRATSFGGIKGVAQRGTPGSDSKSRRKQRVEDNRVTVQPKEDEDNDNFYSKHLAAARFQRNHKLINVLFNEVIVEQNEHNDFEKFNAKQIECLEKRKDKLENEIKQLDELFKSKRAKIMEDGKSFIQKLNEHHINSKKELETIRTEQAFKLEIKRVLYGIIDSVAKTV